MRLHLHRIAACILSVAVSAAQESPAGAPGSERNFPQPVAVVRSALQRLPGGTSGRLPVLDGFVVPGPRPLSGYQRPYYQCEVQVSAAKSGGSLVRVTAKITAWFSGPGQSGYEALESNGRVESDVLDRLQDSLGAGPKAVSGVKPADNPMATKSAAPEIDAPMPRLPEHAAISGVPGKETASPQDNGLQREAKSLEEILRTQSHPTNLIAVKQDNTPVLQNPILDAKVLFLASAEDEFEVLEETPGWVHVRISGLSRGWLRRSAVEMPGDLRAGGSVAIAAPTEKSAETAAGQSPPFSVSSEEIGSFPGEWAALRGKNVKIISLQQATGTGRITSPEEKKQFAAVLFRKEAPGLSPEAAGLVLIFDAEDGGMVATTRSSLDQWRGGTLSEQAFWKQCFLDPPEILGTN